LATELDGRCGTALESIWTSVDLCAFVEPHNQFQRLVQNSQNISTISARPLPLRSRVVDLAASV
jgi:hypothetical protein